MWIKYRYIRAAGHLVGAWLWQELSDEPTEEEIEKAKGKISKKCKSGFVDDYWEYEFELFQYPSQDFLNTYIAYDKKCVAKAKTRIKNIKKYAAKLQNRIKKYENLIEKQKAAGEIK